MGETSVAGQSPISRGQVTFQKFSKAKYNVTPLLFGFGPNLNVGKLLYKHIPIEIWATNLIRRRINDNNIGLGTESYFILDRQCVID